MSGDGSTLWRSEKLVCDAVGQLIEFWGFKRQMGRVWALLYLRESPQSAQDIQRDLSLSAGSVSATVTELLHWGVIKKISVQGERRDYFLPEINLWKMISRVYAERERNQVLDAIDLFEEALEYVDAKVDFDAPQDRQRADFSKARIESLLSLARLGKSLLDSLIKRGQVDVTPLSKLVLGRNKRR